MADSQLYTNGAALAKAADIKTALALSKLRLFTDALIPTRHTTVAELEAAECTYDGYPAGGFTLTAWTGPTIDPNGGAVLTSPLINPAYGPAEDPPMSNDVGGWWVEDAAGNVRVLGRYDPPRPMGGLGSGFPVVIQIVEARNPISNPE